MDLLYDKTYFETHAVELLDSAGLTKAKFAERMGIARQNIQKLFASKNVVTLLKAAETLGVPLDTLLYGEQRNNNAEINGFIEIGETIYRITSKQDLEEVLKCL